MSNRLHLPMVTDRKWLLIILSHSHTPNLEMLLHLKSLVVRRLEKEKMFLRLFPAKYIFWFIIKNEYSSTFTNPFLFLWLTKNNPEHKSVATNWNDHNHTKCQGPHNLEQVWNPFFLKLLLFMTCNWSDIIYHKVSWLTVSKTINSIYHGCSPTSMTFEPATPILKSSKSSVSLLKVVSKY